MGLRKIFLKKVGEKFGGTVKTLYLCTRKAEETAAKLKKLLQ